MADTELLDWLASQTGCALINDDNGHWAVSWDGFQNVPETDEPIDMMTSFFVERGKWRDNIRDAIIAAMRIEEDV